jgi:hypothetical protein
MDSLLPPFARGLLLASSVAACSAYSDELRAPAVAPSSAEPEAAQPAVVRLRTMTTDDAGARAVEEAVRMELRRAGFMVVDGGLAHDVDLLLTVASSAGAGAGAERRTMMTLSPTVGAHVMEDVTGHFVRSDEKVDPVTVREVCLRWKRRFHRFQGVVAGGER